MSTHYEGSETEKEALSAYITLMRAAETVTAKASRTLAESGLSHSQFGVLEALFHLGPLCQKELGNKLLKSSGNITVVIDNLEKRGLVRREQNPEDRRMVTVVLTAEGRAAIAAAFPSHAARITGAMGALAPGEIDELRRLCKKLGLGREENRPKALQENRTGR